MLLFVEYYMYKGYRSDKDLKVGGSTQNKWLYDNYEI